MSVDPRQILLSFGERVARAVAEELHGETIDSVFVAGSVARDEVAAFAGPEGVEIYSDLDLFVVLQDARDAEGARRRARRAAAGVPRVGDGFRIVPEPGVGVFSEEDFLSQKPRPGTVEIAEFHVVLCGNAETPKKAARFIASQIDVTEALYLVENRLCELAGLEERLEEDPSDTIRRYLRYARSKSCLDAASAALIAAGRFHTARGERMRRIREEAPGNGVSRYLPPSAAAAVERAHEDIAGLRATREPTVAYDPSSRGVVEGVLLEVWNRVARDASGLGTGDWERLVGWRAKRGRWIANARELWVLGRRMGVPRRRVIAGAARTGLLSPVDALRLSGVVEALLNRTGDTDDSVRDAGALQRGYVAILDGLTRTFGHGTGPVFRRARRLLRETA
jgi:hypothetical protein